MRPFRAASVLAVAVLLGLVLAPSPVRADGPGATLHLTWSAPSVSQQVFTATLTCHPTGGGEESYMDAEAACADLTQAGGNPAALPGWWFVNCTGYQGWAIRTTATGTWFGQPVSYDVLHANVCLARKATGPVFNF